VLNCPARANLMFKIFNILKNCMVFQMLKRPLILSLIVLLALPLNAGAATWMAMSMTESGEAVELLEYSDNLHHEHQQHMSMGSNHSLDSDSNHEHDSEDCDEHCMSCSSHCYGSSITSAVADFQNQRSLHASTISGVKLTREYLLYRPPIHA
jgi:hypothetical protein